MLRTVLLVGATALGISAAVAQGPSAGHLPAVLVRELPGTTRLTVSSPAFAAGGTIPVANTQYGANLFPGLSWSAGPAGTRSYVVVVQGIAAPGGKEGGETSVHLTLYNLPAESHSLPSGLTTPPGGAALGPNIHGAAAGYAGPHTHDATPHAYHLEVFALDTRLAAPADVEGLRAAMRGHVLASGETIGIAAGPPAPAPVRIDTGLVAGVPGRDPAITVYRGIPYAAPPVGPLRWHAPEPAAAWAGVRKGDRFGPLCPQPADRSRGGPMSEDCLTLNVWTGAPPAGGGKRPVLVWIYGGGFIEGTGSSLEFDGEGLARKGVIVVTFNYRLGALGFMATPQLSAESEHAGSGNYGLLDDIAVLKWVQRNIAAFGGDPTRVTIAGQSAGAGSVGFLAGSPLAKGLFQRGIAESHARTPQDPSLRYLSVSYRPLATAEAAGSAYLAAHGATSLAAARALPWQTLVEGSNTVDASVDTGTTAEPPLFRPVVDGWVVPHTYADELAGHTQNNVLIVAGNNKDESGAVPETAFAALRARTTPPRGGMPQTNVTLAAYQAWAARKFGALAPEFLRLYPAANDDEAARQNNAAARDDNRVSTWLWASEWQKGVTQPVYTYWWSHAPPGPDAALRGAYHGSEINYALGNLEATDRPWTAEDRAIADRMSTYWANIIRNGDPNGPGLPRWPRFDAASPTVMQLGDAWSPIPVASPERIAFWRRFYAMQTAW
jgi:para-nitrobenzyl esterase